MIPRRVTLTQGNWSAMEVNGQITVKDPDGRCYRFSGVIWNEWFGPVIRAYLPSGYVDGISIEGIVNLLRASGYSPVQDHEVSRR